MSIVDDLEYLCLSVVPGTGRYLSVAAPKTNSQDDVVVIRKDGKPTVFGTSPFSINLPFVRFLAANQ